jgi:hypothetical protein
LVRPIDAKGLDGDSEFASQGLGVASSRPHRASLPVAEGSLCHPDPTGQLGDGKGSGVPLGEPLTDLPDAGAHASSLSA